MSQQARELLVSRLVFQDESQKTDLLDDKITQTTLIAHLLYITESYHFEVTAVKSDHHDDSALGPHSHYDGYCADGWPLLSITPGDYMDASSLIFREFLQYAAKSPWLYQIGLGGSAYTEENMQAAGQTAFEDDGADHVHFGAS